MSLDLRKLSAAKLWLISAPAGEAGDDGPRDLAYLSQALYALTPVRQDDVPRMTCDERWRIYVNSAWLDRASVREVAEELVHVVWHLLADHAARARSVRVDRATSRDWSRAADITVSHTLEPDRIRPAHLSTWRETRMGPGRSAEEYFAHTTKLPVSARPDDGMIEPADGCGSGADGLLRGSELGPDADVGAVSAPEAKEIRRRVAIEFRDQQRRRGTVPGDLQRWVTDILEPTTPWQPILTSAVRRAVGWASGRGDFTYARPSRRTSSSPGIVLPGQHRPVPRVSVIVDTSASVDDGLLQKALGEIDGVIAALGIPGASITLYSVDAAVHATEKLLSAKGATLVGAGGTDMRVGLAAIANERPRPDVVIVLTDGGTPWPATPPPGAAVIVALLGRTGDQSLPATPDWAVRVECLRDR